MFKVYAPIVGVLALAAAAVFLITPPAKSAELDPTKIPLITVIFQADQQGNFTLLDQALFTGTAEECLDVACEFNTAQTDPIAMVCAPNLAYVDTTVTQ